MRGKRGVSAVIATILIILLVIAAVAILWAVLKPVIKGTGGKISTSCLDVDLSVPEAECTAGSEKLKVTLNSGTIKKLKIVFYDSTGTSIGDPKIVTDVPAELGTKVYDSSSINFPTDAKSVNVAGVIETATGEEITCGLSLPSSKDC